MMTFWVYIHLCDHILVARHCVGAGGKETSSQKQLEPRTILLITEFWLEEMH